MKVNILFEDSLLFKLVNYSRVYIISLILTSGSLVVIGPGLDQAKVYLNYANIGQSKA